MKQLVRRAEALEIEPPVPDSSILWNREPGKQTVLSADGRRYLKEQIEAAAEKRFEKRVRWLKILAPIVGALGALVGTVTGLVLAFKK